MSQYVDEEANSGDAPTDVITYNFAKGHYPEETELEKFPFYLNHGPCENASNGIDECSSESIKEDYPKETELEKFSFYPNHGLCESGHNDNDNTIKSNEEQGYEFSSGSMFTNIPQETELEKFPFYLNHGPVCVGQQQEYTGYRGPDVACLQDVSSLDTILEDEHPTGDGPDHRVMMSVTTQSSSTSAMK